MTEPWNIRSEESCVTVSVNGRSEKINKGVVSDLGEFISGKAAAAGIGKARVKIDGEEVEPSDIGDYTVSDISTITIDTFDVARTE